MWQIAVLGLLAALLLGLLHRQSAALKHLVGMAFLLLMIAAPVQTFLLLTAENANAGTMAHTDGVLPLLLPVMLNLPQVTSSTSGLVLPWLWCRRDLYVVALDRRLVDVAQARSSGGNSLASDLAATRRIDSHRFGYSP